MLDPRADETARDAVAASTQSKIADKGEVTHESTWGLRKLAYEIEKQTEADYRWYRFRGPSELLSDLDHSLKIADGVLRFRVFRVESDSPVIEAPPVVGAAISTGPPDDDED